MPLFPRRYWCALLLVAAGASEPLSAQGTAPLPPADLAYADLDRLSELSFLDSVIVGQRPYSRREIGRILRAARERSAKLGERRASQMLTDLELAIGDGILRRLETRFAREVDEIPSDEPVISLFDGITLSGASTDAERRGFFAPHTKSIEATIAPVLPRRYGEQVAAGQDYSLELSQRVEPNTWLAFHARERFLVRTPDDTTLPRRSAELLLGGMRVRVRNVALMVGREQIAWAQASGDGLFLASDSPALDLVSLASDHPFALPGFLRRFGPTQATLVVANLGPSLVRSQSKLLAYKVSIQPSPRAEFGATFMNHFGGEGARSSSAVNYLIDFLPFIDIFRRHNYTDSTRALDVDSDKLLGIDGRLRIGGPRGVLLNGELLIDDFDVHRIPKLFTSSGSQSFSISMPRFLSPLVSVKLSAKHMGILTYSHSALTNGITSRGRLLGDELGPDSKAFALQVGWQPTAAARLIVEARSAIYSNASYTSFYENGDSTRYVTRKVSRTRDELRDRLMGTLLVQSEAGPALTIRAGAERARNFLFSDATRTDFVGEIALHLYQ